MTELEYRNNWLYSHFYIHVQNVEEVNNYVIVSREQFLGINTVEDKEILPTIFDDIFFLSDFIVGIKISNRYGFYDLDKKIWLQEPNCVSYTQNSFYNTVEIIINDRHGLICLDERKLLIPAQYEDVTINSMQPFLWIKEKNSYHYIEKATGKLVKMPEAIFAYDTPFKVMFIKKHNGKVECLGANGNLARLEFRKLLCSNGGRLKLQNVKYHKFEIIDIYGQILN